MKLNSASLSLALLFVVFATSCSSVSSRIKDHQAQFNSLSRQAQAQVQNGRIDLGFNEDMVYMAKGKPDDTETITRNGKQIKVWKYAKRDWRGDSHPASTSLSSPYGYPTFGPGPSQPVIANRPLKYLRVEFENGQVARWDRELQAD